MSVTGQHIVISGGGSGAGAEIAAAFAGAGARVSILGRRRKALEKVAAEIRAKAIVCDVTARGDLEAALADARADHGPIGVAIANAGAALSKPFNEMTARDVQSMLDVNLLGTFNLWQASLPDMMESGAGRLIVIASTAGLKGYPYVTGYTAAKHAVIGLTRSLAQELARTGITVNAICPGFMKTPLLEQSIETITAKTGMSTQEAERALRASNPQARFVETGEVASAALWLAGEQARSVNGHALAISGGEI